MKVETIRKRINKNSSDKAKFITGKCGFYKSLSDGLGRTEVITKPIILHDGMKVKNIKINSIRTYHAIIFPTGTKNTIIENITVFKAKTVMVAK